MQFLKIITGTLAMMCTPLLSAVTVDVDGDLNYCNLQIHRALTQLGPDKDYTMMPRNISPCDSVWHCRKVTPDEWCAGFWPGVLWYDYEITGDKQLKEEAEKYTCSLEYLSQRPAFDHDLGFLMFCSYGNAYRLTGDERYKQVVLATADTLATLYSPVVGTILSWPRNVEMLGGHNTIMDNMINLEMLFWAAKNGGDKKLYDIAVRHAEVTMKHHFRRDGTCYHVAIYNPDNGKFIKGITHQGYADNSTWSRGQAWAIYGYTMVYRETNDKKFLNFAKKVTEAYLCRLPDDYVPYWDFDDPSIPHTSRDASAAAVVASALLELQQYVDAKTAARYREAATTMLASLASDRYRSGSKRPSFLDHSTGHRPAGSEIDYSIIYADYYYLEALLRLKRINENKNVFATL